jgi:hypothetical protein
MNTAQIKLALFREIDGLEQNKLSQLYNYLVKKTNKSADFWNELSAAQEADVEAGIADLNKGKKKNFKEVIAKYK